jgi:hypothetical protein
VGVEERVPEAGTTSGIWEHEPVPPAAEGARGVGEDRAGLSLWMRREAPVGEGLFGCHLCACQKGEKVGLIRRGKGGTVMMMVVDG